MTDRPGGMVAALLERIPIADVGRIDNGSPLIGREEEFGTAEVRRSYADDGDGMLVDLHSTTHCCRVAVKVAVPERIAQDDSGTLFGPCSSEA